MNKFILAAFLALLACQSVDSQTTSLIQYVYSLFSFTGYTLYAGWTTQELTTASSSNVVIQVQTTTLTSMVITNSKLGLQCSTTSALLTSTNSTITAMQTQSSTAQMNTVNSLMSESTINLAYTSQINLAYLLVRLETACIGRTVVGIPEAIPGYDVVYPNPTNYSNVGMQAQAVIAFSSSLATEVINYCSQYADLAKTINSNCTSCPTLEQCAIVAQKWQNASLIINVFTNSTVKTTTLIRFVNVTVQGTLIDAINSTNILITGMRECAKCLNTGCTKNQAVATKKCDRRKNNGSMSSGDRKAYCKQKNSSDGRRRSRNISRCRKEKARKSVKRQRANGSKNRGHWKGVWQNARKMTTNFQSNASSIAIPNVLIRNQMSIFGFFFGNYTVISGNVTEQVSQNVTDTANAAKDVSAEMIKNATKTFGVDVYNLTSHINADNIEQCLGIADNVTDLQFEFLTQIMRCDDILANVTQQNLVNISYTYTGWVQRINYWSNCHDRCVGRYCPFLTLGQTTAVGVCWTLKRLFPILYDNSVMIGNYQQCNSECSTQLQVETANLTITGQYLMDCSAITTEQALQQVQQCVDSTLAAYRQKLDQLNQDYQTCVATYGSTTTDSTSTSTSTSTTDSTTSTTDSTTSTTDTTTSTTDSTTSTTDSTTSTTPTTPAPIQCPACSFLNMFAMIAGGPSFMSSVQQCSYIGCFCATGSPVAGPGSINCCNV